MTALATDSGRKTPARLAGSAILAMQSDERLVKLVRTGHERAFDAIVQRYRKPLVNFCRRILPESRCEDAVQQTFINAHAALLASDEQLQLKPWLYAITRNAALNMLRQNGWNYDEIPLDFDGVRRPDQVFEQRAQLQQTVAAVNDLPERQRSALVMRELEGRSYAEIALALGANDGAVRQLLNRARVTLRDAASFLVPPPVVARAAASLPPSDGRRVSEVLAGFGAAGVAKAGATALVAGTLVVGAVEAPLPLGDTHKPTRQGASLAPAKPAADDGVRAHETPVALHPASEDSQHGRQSATPGESHNSGHRHSGTSHRHGTERREPAERERSGGGDDRTNRERSGSSDGSSTSGSGTSGSGDHSGTSGSSGSDDHLVAPTGTSGGSGTSGTSGGSGSSGSSGSGSGDSTVSGSGTSGSDSSGSGSSGSGSTTSGSDDSLTSGSGSSGSSDPLEH
jgi:RNA polymerase sigma factor (sigma-70 family)